MELKDPVAIRVQFVFNAGDPWSRLFDFEKDITTFLGRRGMVPQVVDNIQGQDGGLIIFVRRQTMEEKALPTTNSEEVKDPAQQVKKLQKNIK